MPMIWIIVCLVNWHWSVPLEKEELRLIPNLEVHSTAGSWSKDRGILYLDQQAFSGYRLESYPNGEKKSRMSYWQGKKQGKERSWYSDGTLRSLRYYQNGKKEGRHIGFWENGNWQYQFYFADGLHHGSAQEWYEDGCLYTSFNYEHGIESGTQQSWSSDRTFQANFVTIDGHRYGLIGMKKCK